MTSHLDRLFIGAAVLFLGVVLGSSPAVRAADVAAAKAGDARQWTELTPANSFAAWRDDRHGWTAVGETTLDPQNNERLTASGAGEVLLSDGDAANLLSRDDYQDVDVSLEFMVPRGSNSGVKLNGLYEIQIRDSHGVETPTGDSCGGIYPRAKLEPRYKLLDAGFPPRQNVAKPAGEWQTLELSFASPRFDAAGKKMANARFDRVAMNGQVIHEKVELTSPTGHAWNTLPEVAQGPLMLQGDHGPIAFRKVRVRPHVR